MLRADRLLAGVCLAALCAAANGMTLGELRDKQAEIAKAEMEVKVQEARAKMRALETSGLPPAPGKAQHADTVGDDAGREIGLASVYGVGRTLRADIAFRGMIIPMVPGSKEEIAGWRLHALTPSKAVLIKAAGKNRGKLHEIFLGPVADLSAKDGAAPLPPPVQPGTSR